MKLKIQGKTIKNSHQIFLDYSELHDIDILTKIILEPLNLSYDRYDLEDFIKNI